MIHWQCLTDLWWHKCLVFSVHEDLEPFLSPKWFVILSEDIAGLGRKHFSGFPKHCYMIYILSSWSPCPQPCSQKDKGKTVICNQNHFSLSASLGFSWIWVISPHPPAIPAEMTVFHCTSTFHLFRTCFLSGSEDFVGEGVGRAPKPSLWQGFLAIYFLLHIKVHWRNRNLKPLEVIYIRKYTYHFL